MKLLPSLSPLLHLTLPSAALGNPCSELRTQWPPSVGAVAQVHRPASPPSVAAATSLNSSSSSSGWLPTHRTSQLWLGLDFSYLLLKASASPAAFSLSTVRLCLNRQLENDHRTAGSGAHSSRAVRRLLLLQSNSLGHLLSSGQMFGVEVLTWRM